MNMRNLKLKLWLALAGLIVSSGVALAVAETDTKTARDFFNDGVQQLRTNKLREAESALQIAVASNDERLQPPALYNLGHVRFRQGVDALKEAPKPEPAVARGDAATNRADVAIKAADAALAGNDENSIVRAYMQGRGARKELKAASEAVRKALEAHGTVLRRWERASGDFKSAEELRPKFEDAKFNANVVDRCIAALVDKQEMMMKCSQCMGGKKKDLKQRMDALKKKMPDGAMKQDDGEEEDDDEDSKKPPKEPKAGDQEKENKEGKRMELTWEEAMRLLDSLKLDGNRKLPMGDKETGTPKDRHGKDW